MPELKMYAAMWLFDHYQLPHRLQHDITAYLLLSAICSHMSDDGICHLAAKDLAAHAQTTPRNVARAAKRLEDENIIHVIRERGKHNRYRIPAFDEWYAQRQQGGGEL